MSYQAGIPTATQIISASQPNLKDNFTAIDTGFSTNHVPFNDANVGKHKFVTAVEQAAGPATAANEMALYSKDLAGISTLYLRKENNGTEIIMSGADPILSVIGGTTQGTTFLPGGFTLNFGLVNCAAGANAPKSFATNFTIAVFSVTLSCQNTVQTQTATAVASLTDITIYSSGIQPVFYMAIGV